MPKMGTSRKVAASPPRPASLADALFSTIQQRVLALLFGQPERSFYTSESIRMVKSGSGAVQRELARLQQNGLITVRRSGAQKHCQANPDTPLLAELCSIISKTLGLDEPIRLALSALEQDIRVAFVYGSVAKRKDNAASDIDLMVLSDRISYSEIMGVLEAPGNQLGRPVNPTIYSAEDWSKRVREGNAFVTRILQQPKLWIIGDDRDLPS